MFENRSEEKTVLNWRGPLLAAGIFAIVSHELEAK